MSTSPFLNTLLPAPAPADDRYIWAKVTQSSPLRIQVDGDRTPLPITPDDLGGGPRPLDQRVYCQILNRRLVVLGPVVFPAVVDLTPAGVMFEFAGSVAPTGYVFADGAAYSRTTYATLYAALGGLSSPWGQGDGSTTFNVPNRKGRVAVGRDAAQTEFDTLGETGGAKTHQHTSPAHAHPLSDAGWADIRISVGSTTLWARIITVPSRNMTHQMAGLPGPTSIASASSAGTGLGGSTDSTTPADTGAASSLQPYVVVNYIIKT